MTKVLSKLITNKDWNSVQSILIEHPACLKTVLKYVPAQDIIKQKISCSDWRRFPDYTPAVVLVLRSDTGRPVTFPDSACLLVTTWSSSAACGQLS